MRGLRSAAWSLIALGACAHTTQTAPPAVELRDPSEGPELTLRQEVTVTYGAGEPRSFDAVLESRPEALKLVGLTPINTVLFVIAYDGEALRFDNRTGEELPFDPAFILRDVQRAFYPWLGDGEREGDVFGQRVRERFEGEELRERLFLRGGAAPFRVRFSEEGRGVRIEDPERGYRLDIRSASSP